VVNQKLEYDDGSWQETTSRVMLGLKLLVVVEALELDSITFLLMTVDRKLTKGRRSCLGSPDTQVQQTAVWVVQQRADMWGNHKDWSVGRYRHQRGSTVLPAVKGFTASDVAAVCHRGCYN
jgi:hypothetical protein